MNSRTFETTGRVLTTAVAALTALALSTGVASAQQGTVTGQVMDASNLEPVVGAQVFFPDLDQGTLTNEEGRYRITGVPAGQHEIRVRLLGYRPSTQRVTVESGQTVTADFRLSVSAVSLGEIVVTQTGEREQRSLGARVSTVDVTQEMEKSNAGTVQDLLKGRATGIRIESGSGSVGTAQNIRIRGNSSITLNNDPLIYIDGVRVNSDQSPGGFDLTGNQNFSRINDLNPEDIESIQILKGPSATTLYGSEAASGVLVIETRRGSAGDTRWTARAEAGGNWDSTDWMNFAFTGADTIYQMSLMEGAHPGIASPFRTGFEQTYAGNVRGGFSEGNVTYYASAQYVEQEGNLPTNKVNQWNARLNSNFSPSEKVDISISQGFTSNTSVAPQNDNNGSGYLGNGMLGIAAFAPMRRPDPATGGPAVQTCPLAFEAARNPAVPLAAVSGACGLPFFSRNFDDVSLTQATNDSERYTGSGTLTFRPWDFLTTRATAGYDESDQDNEFFEPVVPRLQPTDTGFRGFLLTEKMRQTSLTLRASATAEASITDEIGSSTNVGAEFFDESTDESNIQCRTFPAGSPACNNAVEQLDLGDFFVQERTLGLFAEQEFSWRNRLFLTAGVRLDENSAFGEEVGQEMFPRAALSYVVSDEEWFPGLFDQFKVRGAWGQSGKQPGTNDALDLLEATFTPINGTERLGVTRDQPGNTDLSQARVTEVEAGVDMSFLNGRLSSSFTWYRQTTTDDIIGRPLPGSTGFAEERSVNIGGLVNTGIEADVQATAFSLPDLVWDWGIQVSTNYNEITDLASPIDVSRNQRHDEGRALGEFFQRQISVDGGVPTATATREFFGADPTPNVSGSLSSTVTLFNHVTLYALGAFNTGHQRAFETGEFGCFFLSLCSQNFYLDADGTLSEEAIRKSFAAPNDIDTPWIDDADHAILRTVSLRFDLPQSWTRFMSGRNVSFSVVGENLATFTGWEGSHPELNGFGNVDGAAVTDFLTLPPARRVTASLSVSF